MHNAEMYHRNNELQKRDILQCLQEFGTKIKWKRFGERVIDIGSGDGSVTVDILKKKLPPNYEKFVAQPTNCATHISEEMVRFSKENYSGVNIEFQVLNIEGQPPEIMRNSFDHAVSFYALHWVEHQEEAFTNIYELLTEGGGCWLMFLGHAVLFEVYRQLSRTNRWHHWLKDVERYISPYQDSQEPGKEVKQIMKKIGFTNIDVVTKPMNYVFDNVQLFKNAVTALNPFKIPKDIFNDYLDDVINVLRYKNEAFVNNRGLINEALHYTVLIATGNK